MNTRVARSIAEIHRVTVKIGATPIPLLSLPHIDFSLKVKTPGTPTHDADRKRGYALTYLEPLLPTRPYRMLCHDATLLGLEVEHIWPMGAPLE